MRLTLTRLLKLTRQEDADTLARLVEDPEPELREAALEAFSDDVDRFLELLRERVRAEPSSSLRRKWLRHWWELEGNGVLLSFAALVIALPMKIEGGSGGPLRAVALVAK